MATGTDIGLANSIQNDVWSLGCDIIVEDMGVVLQEIKTDDVVLTGSIAVEELSIDVDYDRINIMNLDVNVSFNGLSSSILESQVVPFSRILEMNDFSPEISNEKRYAASAYAAKRISDSVYTVEQKNNILSEKIDSATGIANTANASIAALGVRVDGVDKTIKEINDKLDGVVENYYDDYIPSKDKLPASQWIADGTEQEHIGDTFTNTSLDGDNAGRSWRWLEQKDGSYDWQLITDTDATKALALAAEAKAAADGKTKTFLVTPTNYEAGDIWIVGDTVPEGFLYEKGSILYAIADGKEYYSSNWLIYAEYVSKSYLEDTVGAINKAIKDAEDASKDYSDEGKAALQELIDNLAATKANTIDVYDRATMDGKLSKSEVDAIEAAKNYADTQNELLQTTLKVYADGVATDAEKKAIADAQAKVDAAKQELQNYTDTKIGEYKVIVDSTTEELNKAIDDAEAAAKKYSDDAQAALQESIDDLYDSKAAIEDVYEKSVADNLINSAEQRAIDAAQNVADEAQRVAEENVKAYADGKVSEAEKNAIDTANKNLAAAKQELEAAIAEVEEIANTADAATKTLEAEIGEVKSGLTESVAEINARLDGVVENYFEEGAPTTKNKPVTDWIAASEDDDYELINHVGDTYTNIQEYVNNDKTPTAGKSWRWCWCDDSSITDKIEVTDKEGVKRYLHWHPIADSDAVKALLEASKAKTAADGKSKTFITEPVPPYSEGDLWVQGESGDIYRCKNGVDKTSGSFDSSDWELASKYTDDTKANEAMDEAVAAKEVAETAKAATDALNNDGLFTVAEKRSIRKALKDINPAEGSATIPIEWSVLSRETIEGNAWTEITDKSDSDYGWYVSDMHESDGFTIAKISFRVNVKSDVDVYIKSRAESNYDYTLLSKLDVTLNQSDTYLTTARVADTTRGRQNIERKYTFTDVAEGNHFVTVMYRKDSTTNTQPDNGYFKVETDKFAEGSLGDWMSIVQDKGLDIAICDPAVDAADELFSYLDNIGKVWENTSNEVPEGFRDEVYRLFAAYYKEVSAILVDTATSDLDYLSDAMKKGNTIVDNGLVMTSLVAVGDTENPSTANVGAFMNGSSFARDTEHGKLMHALGIPLTTEDGNEDLEARSKEAKTRIYEDGHIETNDIKATGGVFSNVKVLGSSRSPFVKGALLINNETQDNHYNFDEFGAYTIFLNNDISQSGRIITAAGNFVVKCENGYIYDNGTPFYNEDVYVGPIASLTGSAGRGDPNIGFEIVRFMAVSISSTEVSWIVIERRAFGENSLFTAAPFGMFAGLRPNARVITSNKTATSRNTLSRYDFSVLVNTASGTCFIQLPTSPLDGQEYVIESKVAMNIAASQNIYQFYSGTTVKQVTTSGKQVLRFKYYASANQWTCIIMA